VSLRDVVGIVCLLDMVGLVCRVNAVGFDCWIDVVGFVGFWRGEVFRGIVFSK
jgi:hypothetical protein